MNDVNLNSTGLKLVSAAEPKPVQSRAVPSSPAEGEQASALASLSNVRVTDNRPQVSSVEEESGVQVLQESGQAPREELEEAVSQLNDYVQNVQRDLQFEVDSELGHTIVRVVDQQTQEVIRQIPDEVALRLAENLQQDEPLTLFNIKV